MRIQAPFLNADPDPKHKFDLYNPDFRQLQPRPPLPGRTAPGWDTSPRQSLSGPATSPLRYGSSGMGYLSKAVTVGASYLRAQVPVAPGWDTSLRQSLSGPATYLPARQRRASRKAAMMYTKKSTQWYYSNQYESERVGPKLPEFIRMRQKS